MQLPVSAPRVAPSNRRGSTILVALLVVVLVATLSMIFVQVSLAKNKEQRQSVDSKRAFYMAEAGLTEGFMALRLGKSGNIANADLPAEFGHGLFWVEAIDLGSGRVRLESTGLCGAGRAKLGITVEKKSATVSALGFFGDQGITVNAGGLIDSYDSRLGPYLGQALLAPLGSLLSIGAKVGGNGDITVKGGSLLSPTSIYGHVKPGPAGTLFRSGSVNITGSMAPNTVLAPLPAVNVPTVARGSDIDINKSATLVVSKGVYAMKKLRVKDSGSLTIEGPATIIAEKVEIEKGAAVNLDARNGPINVYVTDSMDLATTSRLNTLSTDPLAVSLQLADKATASLGAGGKFYGSIYAPKSSVTIPATFVVFGSVVAETLTIAANGTVHFDRAFTAGTSEDIDGTPSLLGWHIMELPNVPVVNLRVDALGDLLKKGKKPKKAKDSHNEVGED